MTMRTPQNTTYKKRKKERKKQKNKEGRIVWMMHADMMPKPWI
jgi:hypothetical protein